MTAYQNCKAGEITSMTIHNGDAEAGYGFSILSDKNRPIVSLSFEELGHAEHARVEIARAVQMAIGVTPQG